MLHSHYYITTCHQFLGVRSLRHVFKTETAKMTLDCILFCLKEENCKSLNYAADLASVNDGEKNCELQSETKINDEKLIKDKRYTFYLKHENQAKPVPTVPHIVKYKVKFSSRIKCI